MLAGVSHVWIGLNDLKVEGQWLWNDGSNLTFSDWNSTEPNNSGDGEDCAILYTTGLRKKVEWCDLSCSEKHRYVCEKPRVQRPSKFVTASLSRNDVLVSILDSLV